MSCLQTDGYVGYHDLAARQDITHIACMAHARRKFEQALENDPERAKYALVEIQKLYTLERSFREDSRSVDQIKALRIQETMHTLDNLKVWLEDQYGHQVLPQNRMGKAIAYSFRLWLQLIGYTQN